jgi:hypothetical protein
MRSIGSPADWITDERPRPLSRVGPVLALAMLFSAIVWLDARSDAAPQQRFDGFNVIVSPGHPFGSPSASVALANAKRLGAGTVAIIPFLWQSNPASPEITRGADMDDGELRAAIQAAHALGLTVLVKPHVWVPQSWAGAIVMQSKADWEPWFANYQRELCRFGIISVV